ncbi:MAG: sensor histidine kinase [Acidobacteriota bacterium]
MDRPEDKQPREGGGLSDEQLRQSQKMEALGKLAGKIAHDFNNILTAVVCYADLVLERMSAADPSRNDVLEIQKAAGRATELTNQLLSFSRKPLLQPTVLDVNEVVEHLQSTLLQSAAEPVRLELALAANLDRVKADRGRIEQVLVDLVANAYDAMPGGGVILLETKNVDRSAHPTGRCVMLAVGDTGKGMDAQTQAQIFDPFFSTKEKGKRTGLGLSIAYGIVQQSGGAIECESEVGRGTTFRIFLRSSD